MWEDAALRIWSEVIRLLSELKRCVSHADWCVERNRSGDAHSIAVHERSIGRVQVLNHPLVIPEHQARVVRRGDIVPNHQAGITRAADGELLLGKQLNLQSFFGP